MVNYQLGKIYKIVDNTNSNVYIGSTCEPTLAKRLAKHVGNFRSWSKGKSNFMSSFNIIQNGNYDIVLIENSICNNKDELLARERYYVETIKCINKNIPNRTVKEYREANKEFYLKLRKDYYQSKKEFYQQKYQKNKDILNKKFNCECGGKYIQSHKLRHLKTKMHVTYIESLLK